MDGQPQRGGYTFVNCMPNTNPGVFLLGAIAQSVMDEAKRVGLCDVNQCVSITKRFCRQNGEPSARLPKKPSLYQRGRQRRAGVESDV